jgi:hypothetical protein
MSYVLRQGTGFSTAVDFTVDNNVFYHHIQGIYPGEIAHFACSIWAKRPLSHHARCGKTMFISYIPFAFASSLLVFFFKLRRRVESVG